MPRGKPKGLPKTGGRSKGTPNKRTLMFAEMLEAKGLDVIKEMKRAIDSDNVDMFRALTDLIPYMAPKLLEREIDLNDAPETAEGQDLSSLTSEQLAAVAKSAV